MYDTRMYCMYAKIRVLRSSYDSDSISAIQVRSSLKILPACRRSNIESSTFRNLAGQTRLVTQEYSGKILVYAAGAGAGRGGRRDRAGIPTLTKV